MALALLLIFGAQAQAQAQQSFLAEKDWIRLRDEASGMAPFENLRLLTRLHRVPATEQFEQAVEFIRQRAIEYGLSEVHVEHFPIDGQIHYGLMRSHLAWKVERGRLWQIAPEHILLGDWATDPIRLADYSHSADVEAELVDVGAGSDEADYRGRDVRGKLVLADGSLSQVQRLAIIAHGAAGIVSDMPNQRTAWSGENEELVRWGHLDASLPSGFAFMISRATAKSLRQTLAKGETIRLQASVTAEVGPGQWSVVSAIIPGQDSSAGEIVYSCHLDHQRPGANDNGSGCVTILESARMLARLIAQGDLPRPARTIRFLWGPEVEGTMAFLAQHPDLRAGFKADIHMDMVGGDPFKNKAILHVTETPWSLPSFVTDIGGGLAEQIARGATRFAEEGAGIEAAVIEQRDGGKGSRNLFLMDETPYAEGSDHDDYDSSTIAVPSLYLRDWPDIYIHTDHDTLEQIDATKLRRVALLGAASGYVYATLRQDDLPRLLPWLTARASERLARCFGRAQSLSPQEAHNLIDRALEREQGMLRSAVNFSGAAPSLLTPFLEVLSQQAGWMARAIGPAEIPPPAKSRRIPERIGEFGPLTFQNDDVLRDRLGAEALQQVKLLAAGGSRLVNVQDQSALYAYEIVNFIDGKRDNVAIRNAVSAEFGPIPQDLVDDYLGACARAGIIRFH